MDALIALALVCLSLIWTAKAMVAMHPFQNVYFNRLAGESMDKIKASYDLYYWGISYRQALEYILANDKKDLERLLFVDRLEDADYFVGNYTWHKEEYLHGSEYFPVKLKGANIVAVHKIVEAVM